MSADRARAVAAEGSDGDVDLKLRAARLWIITHRPYYSRALFACPLIVTTAVATMSIDERWRIYANPGRIAELSVAQTAGLIIHNLNHALRQHAERGRVFGVDAHVRNVWRAACDCEIDDDLASDGLTVPEDLLFPYMFDLPNGRTAEQYHDDLLLDGRLDEDSLDLIDGWGETVPQPSCGSAVTGVADTHELPDADGLDSVDQQMLRRSVAQAISDHIRAHGRVPAGLERWADAELNPRSTGARCSLPRSDGQCTTSPARRITRGSGSRGAKTPHRPSSVPP